MPRRLIYITGSTKKICQLTGECDRGRGQFTTSRTESRFGLVGTDLGSSFEHDGRLYFLFGDTVAINHNPFRPPAGDSIAWTRDTDPERCLRLEFLTAPDGGYLSPSVQPHISLGPFEVPLAGFSAHGKMYVFFSTDWNGSADNALMGRSVLTWSSDGGQTPFHYLYDLSVLKAGGRFINLSPVIMDNAVVGDLPDRDGQGLLLWGSGTYRKSDPYLAYLPLRGVEDRGNLRYFAGIEAGTRRPLWSTDEADAMALFHHPEIGEFSVIWNQSVGLWMMLYNAGNPRGINFRVAERPWGPWSPTAVLFDPWTDGGYCHFMHANWDNRVCDFVYDPGQEMTWAGEYGPYMISRFTQGDSRTTTIYFVMSTWNPYNTMLMKSSLVLDPTGAGTQLSGNPALIQSRFGRKGNFEVVAPVASGGLAHYWRNNDNPSLPWSAPTFFGAGQFDAVSLIQSNFGSPGNLEVVARAGDQLMSLWREGPPGFTWHGPYPIVVEGAGGPCSRRPVSGVTGDPALIQSRYGAQGNFEVIVPLLSGGIAHYFRDNDASGLPWKGAPVFATSAGTIAAVTLIQSNFGSPGNLEVIARAGDRLVFLWRDSSLAWHGPFPFVADGREVSGVASNPSLVQSRFGVQGNFELVVPLATGGFAFFWRDNDVQPGLPWHGPFGMETRTRFEALSLIQSNFDDPGNLEVVARIGDQLAHSWRDSGPNFLWNGPFGFTSP